MPVSEARKKKPALWHLLKRWLFILHRWLGIASCLLFAMWFLSGLVMLYVPFPELTRSERLSALKPIDFDLVRPPTGPNLRAAGIDAPPRVLLLEMRGSYPVWQVIGDNGGNVVLSANDGRPLLPPTESQARAMAESFGHRAVQGIGRIERDQWTVSGRFDGDRPLWKAELAGPGGRVLYVSGTSGAVVLDTDRRERFWNWLGSVPHWLYPTVLRQNNGAWRQVVMWVSGPCIAVGLTGFWIGILRTRLGRRRYKHGRMTPYRGWMEWHHWAGLIGGVTLITWIFSGWLSVDPFRLFARGGIDPVAEAAYEGVGWPPRIDVARLAKVASGARQVELFWVKGRALLEARDDSSARVLDAATLKAPDRAIDPASLVPGAGVASIDRQTEPDAYWYAAGSLPRLPVLRVRYADPARTWIYLDPVSGRILGGNDARSRLYRWLFDLLHKWDFNLLTLNRPAWDIVIWLLSLLGVVTSVSGVWIGWKRLRRA